MFIYVMDKQLSERLIKEGFNIVRTDDKGILFAQNKKLNFDFSKVDKNKFIFTNKLNF